MLSGSIDTHLDSDSAQDYDMDENSSNLNQQAREGIALAARQALIEGEKPAGKRRNINSRRAPKLQASTLLGPNGFRLLRRLSHNASAPIDLDSSIPNGDTDNCHLEDVDPKASRRMQRQRDLRQFDRIMASYRDWTHKLYPKYKFRDLVIKIERLCRTPTLKAYKMALERAISSGQDFDEVSYAADQITEEAEKMAGISLDMDNVNISPSSEDSLDEKMMVYSDDDDF